MTALPARARVVIVGGGVIGCSLAYHLTKLGVVVQNDGGLLFGLALAVFAGGLAILVLRRQQLPLIGGAF